MSVCHYDIEVTPELVTGAAGLSRRLTEHGHSSELTGRE